MTVGRRRGSVRSAGSGWSRLRLWTWRASPPAKLGFAKAARGAETNWREFSVGGCAMDTRLKIQVRHEEGVSIATIAGEARFEIELLEIELGRLAEAHPAVVILD